jgi:hypothetical protein
MCPGCLQIRSDLATAVTSGHLTQAVKIVVKAGKLIAPAVTRNLGR